MPYILIDRLQNFISYLRETNCLFKSISRFPKLKTVKAKPFKNTKTIAVKSPLLKGSLL